MVSYRGQRWRQTCWIMQHQRSVRGMPDEASMTTEEEQDEHQTLIKLNLRYARVLAAARTRARAHLQGLGGKADEGAARDQASLIPRRLALAAPAAAPCPCLARRSRRLSSDHDLLLLSYRLLFCCRVHASPAELNPAELHPLPFSRAPPAPTSFSCGLV